MEGRVLGGSALIANLIHVEGVMATVALGSCPPDAAGLDVPRYKGRMLSD